MLLRYQSKAMNVLKNIKFCDNKVSGKVARSMDGLVGSDDRL